MADYFREMYDGILETARGLEQANAGIVVAVEGIKRTTTAAKQAHEEQEDLRVTVARLESLVMELSTEVRALRDRRA